LYILNINIIHAVSKFPPKCFHLAESIYRVEGLLSSQDLEEYTGGSVESFLSNKLKEALILQIGDLDGGD
jgi:hypothetical protein